MYIYICCTRYRYARCVIAIETCASWNMGPWEATWHGKLNRTRSVSRFCRVLVYTLTNDVSIVSRINISYIVPATCSFFTVKRVLRTHALFIKRVYGDEVFTDQWRKLRQPLTLFRNDQSLLDRNRVSLSVDTSSKYIFYQPIEKLCKFVQI